ncbi:hypothetical protein BDF21DRAFT_474179 [Thamnidium elegans]|nr:hypothetical protein BDF21DRAFT_474179 [Thamnidium elegans]
MQLHASSALTIRGEYPNMILLSNGAPTSSSILFIVYLQKYAILLFRLAENAHINHRVLKLYLVIYFVEINVQITTTAIVSYIFLTEQQVVYVIILYELLGKSIIYRYRTENIDLGVHLKTI